MLINALKNLSQTPNTQVIITTHSPIIVKELDFENLRLVYEDEGAKCVLPVKPAALQYPSLNEVNYVAYGEATEEYHDELYGFLEFHQWLDGYKSGKRQRPYVQVKKGKTKNLNLDLTTYIRHQIHHPENHINPHFTMDELRESIEDMRNYIRKRAEEEKIWEPIPNNE